MFCIWIFSACGLCCPFWIFIAFVFIVHLHVVNIFPSFGRGLFFPGICLQQQRRYYVLKVLKSAF